MYIYLNFIPIIINWTIHNFIKKNLVSYLSPFQMLVLIHITYHMLFLSYLLYLFKTKNKQTKNFFKGFKKLPKKYYIFNLSLMVISLIAFYAYYDLISNYDVNYVVPIIRGGSQLLILLIGYFIYKENITKYTVMGVLMILSGIYFIK